MSPVQMARGEVQVQGESLQTQVKSNMEEGVLKPAAITLIFDILLIETLQVCSLVSTFGSVRPS